MAKKIQGYIKLQIPAGKANPSPPVGPALGQQGLNIMDFCKALTLKHKILNLAFQYQLLLQHTRIRVLRL